MEKIYLPFFILITLSLSTVFAQTGSFVHDGLTREYRYHIPPGYVSGTPIPLVINMHGAGSNALQQEAYTTILSVANEKNFIVVHPEGIDNVWNSGGITSNVDDVGFISALIDRMGQSYTINTNRVYACGMSNGGFMSYRLACELEDKIAAIASVTGLLANSVQNTCQNTRPIAVLQIHGTDDTTVDYDGYPGVYLSTDATMDFWIQHNNCTQTPKMEELDDVDPDDGCTATYFHWDSGDDDTEVDLYRINGGEHTWPDAIIDIEVTNRDFNATRTIWAFFEKHALDGPIISEVKELDEVSFQLSPNPSTDFVNLTLPKSAEQISVFDLSGRVIFNSMNKNVTQINTEKWTTGLYFVEVRYLDGTKQVEKLMVQ